MKPLRADVEDWKCVASDGSGGRASSVAASTSTRSPMHSIVTSAAGYRLALTGSTTPRPRHRRPGAWQPQQVAGRQQHGCNPCSSGDATCWPPSAPNCSSQAAFESLMPSRPVLQTPHQGTESHWQRPDDASPRPLQCASLLTRSRPFCVLKHPARPQSAQACLAPVMTLIATRRQIFCARGTAAHRQGSCR